MALSQRRAQVVSLPPIQGNLASSILTTKSPEQLARDLEVLAAMREQIELQKDLLQREYAISTGQDEPLSHEQAGHAYNLTREAIKTAQGGRDGETVEHPSGPL